MNYKCAWCSIEKANAVQMYSYTCEEHNIGRTSEKFTGGLLPINLCKDCLEKHILKEHSQSHWAECLRKEKEDNVHQVELF